MISKAERHGDYAFAVVSDTGINHRLDDKPNQDAIDFRVSGDDFAMAVSDGVGSCANAELGAQAAVSAVMRAFEFVRSADLRPNVSNIAGFIVNTWKELLKNEKLDDCCATLKAVIKYGNKLLLFSIGDGFLIVTSGGLNCQAPQDNDVFINQTTCLSANVKPSDFWVSRFDLDTYMPYAILVCSDGVANGIQTGHEIEMVAEIEAGISKDDLLSELKGLVADLAEYGGDDRTVGVVKYERTNAESDR